MKYRNWLIKSAVISLFALAAMGCSEAILNVDECSEARNAVKQFYSFHFGNDMAPSAGGLEVRSKFLSKRLVEKLVKEGDTSSDYFTRSEEFPKAFRVGMCEMNDSSSASLEVLLFWKSGESKEQRAILVGLKNDGTSWLIDEVKNK